MGAVKHSELRRGDENRPPTPDISEHPIEWERSPAPSMRELACPKGVTEGVSFDEWERLNIQSFVGAATSRPQPEGFNMLG